MEKELKEKLNNMKTREAMVDYYLMHPIDDFPRLNKYIIDRWSLSGLKYIKNLAWKLHDR